MSSTRMSKPPADGGPALTCSGDFFSSTWRCFLGFHGQPTLRWVISHGVPTLFPVPSLPHSSFLPSFPSLLPLYPPSLSPSPLFLLSFTLLSSQSPIFHLTPPSPLNALPSLPSSPQYPLFLPSSLSIPSLPPFPPSLPPFPPSLPSLPPSLPPIPLPSLSHCCLGSNVLYIQFAQLCSGLLVFSVFAFAQPYKSKIANILEALTLLDLLLISAIYLNTDVLVVEELQPLATTLLLAPFIVALPYLICKITAFVWYEQSTN